MRPGFLATSAGRTVALVFGLNGFLFANWFTRIPAVKAELGLSDGALGLALLGAPIGTLLVMTITGALVERLGAARTTMVSSAALCLAVVGPALGRDVLSLAAALAILGVAAGAMDIAMNAEAALLERSARRSIMVGFHAMFSLGGALGALTGSLAALGLPPMAHLLLAGAAGLLVLASRRGTLPRDEPPKGGAPLFAIPRGVLLPIALVAFVSMLGEGAAADWGAVYIHEVLGRGAAVAGAGFAAFAVAMTLGRLIGDAACDRLGDRLVVRLGCGLAAAGLTGALLAARLPAALLGFACLGLGLAAVVPVCFRQAAQRSPFGAGHGLAAVAAMGYTGFLTGPPLIGLLADAIGLGRSLLAVPILLALVGIPAARWLDPGSGRDA